jgi:hypothetical protein
LVVPLTSTVSADHNWVSEGELVKKDAKDIRRGIKDFFESPSFSGVRKPDKSVGQSSPTKKTTNANMNC